jgi:hypothetical protein
MNDEPPSGSVFLMDASFQDVLQRLDQLPGHVPELPRGIRQAMRIAGDDPEMALTRMRKVLEYIIRHIFECHMGEPAGTRPLENLQQRLVREGHFPKRLEPYADLVRGLGNVGTHSFTEQVTADDVLHSLQQFLPILEWYLREECPVPPAAASPAAAVAAPVPPSPRPRLRPSQAERVLVIPKGLRSFDRHDSDFFLELLPGPHDRDGLPDSLRFWKTRIEPTEELRLCRKPSHRPQGAQFVCRRCIVADTPDRLHCRATTLPCNGCNDCNDATIRGTDSDNLAWQQT